MGFRFRRTLRLGQGLRVNLSTGGASLSAGRPGFTTNVGRRGVRATVGLPGTGLSYTAQASRRGRGAGGAVLVLLAIGVLVSLFLR